MLHGTGISTDMKTIILSQNVGKYSIHGASGSILVAGILIRATPSYGVKGKGGWNPAQRGRIEKTCLMCKKRKFQLLFQVFSSDSGSSNVCNGMVACS